MCALRKHLVYNREGGGARLSDLCSLLHLYDTLLVSILFIVSLNLRHRLFLTYSLFSIFNAKNLEFTWTLLPGIYALFFSIPACRHLYNVEGNVHYGSLNMVLGNQWYWTYQQYASTEYEYTLYRGALTSSSVSGNRGVAECWAISSNDVIHSWGVSRISRGDYNIKIDAYPRRLSVFCYDRVRPDRIYLRYCSELCRAHHAYMPISLVAV